MRIILLLSALLPPKLIIPRTRYSQCFSKAKKSVGCLIRKNILNAECRMAFCASLSAFVKHCEGFCRDVFRHVLLPVGFAFGVQQSARLYLGFALACNKDNLSQPQNLHASDHMQIAACGRHDTLNNSLAADYDQP